MTHLIDARAINEWSILEIVFHNHLAFSLFRIRSNSINNGNTWMRRLDLAASGRAEVQRPHITLLCKAYIIFGF